MVTDQQKEKIELGNGFIFEVIESYSSSYSYSTNKRFELILSMLQEMYDITPMIRNNEESYTLPEFTEMIQNKITASLLGISPEGTEGLIKMLLLHEIGELTKINQIKTLFPSINCYNYSAIFPTDVYGDFLVASLAPITPSAQINIISYIKEQNPSNSKLRKLVSPKLSPNETEYVYSFANSFACHIEEGIEYVTVPLEGLIKKTLGMSRKQRKKAYLDFVDKDLELTLESLPKLEAFQDPIIAANNTFFEILRR